MTWEPTIPTWLAFGLYLMDRWVYAFPIAVTVGLFGLILWRRK